MARRDTHGGSNYGRGNTNQFNGARLTLAGQMDSPDFGKNDHDLNVINQLERMRALESKSITEGEAHLRIKREHLREIEAELIRATSEYQKRQNKNSYVTVGRNSGLCQQSLHRVTGSQPEYDFRFTETAEDDDQGYYVLRP